MRAAATVVGAPLVSSSRVTNRAEQFAIAGPRLTMAAAQPASGAPAPYTRPTAGLLIGCGPFTFPPTPLSLFTEVPRPSMGGRNLYLHRFSNGALCPRRIQGQSGFFRKCRGWPPWATERRAVPRRAGGGHRRLGPGRVCRAERRCSVLTVVQSQVQRLLRVGLHLD